MKDYSENSVVSAHRAALSRDPNCHSWIYNLLRIIEEQSETIRFYSGQTKKSGKRKIWTRIHSLKILSDQGSVARKSHAIDSDVFAKIWKDRAEANMKITQDELRILGIIFCAKMGLVAQIGFEESPELQVLISVGYVERWESPGKPFAYRVSVKGEEYVRSLVEKKPMKKGRGLDALLTI